MTALVRPLAIERGRLRQIVTLALPLVGGMVSQNVLNLVDTAMVGDLGNAALAAVGLGGFVNFMATAFITGLSAGVQAMAARRVGEGRAGESAVPLTGGLVMVTAIAVPWSILLIALAPYFYPYLHSDPEVIAAGVPFLQARLIGALPLGLNFAFRGYWSGVKEPSMYLRTLLVMHASNIFLNWVLIYGHLGAPELGATGSGIATTIATFIGTSYYFLLGLRRARAAGFLRGIPERATMRTMLRVSVPSGLQQFFFAAGLTALYWIIGQVGTREGAAANVLTNLTLVMILPGLGLGLAAATMVGQALGRRDPDDAERWGWEVSRIATAALGLLGLPLLLVPDLVLRGFLDDPVTRELARAPLQLVGASIALEGFGMVLVNCLLGAGASRTVMTVSIAMQWGLFLPAAYLVGPELGYGLLAIWIANVIYRALQAAILARLWRRRGWASVRV